MRGGKHSWLQHCKQTNSVSTCLCSGLYEALQQEKPRDVPTMPVRPWPSLCPVWTSPPHVPNSDVTTIRFACNEQMRPTWCHAPCRITHQWREEESKSRRRSRNSARITGEVVDFAKKRSRFGWSGKRQWFLNWHWMRASGRLVVQCGARSPALLILHKKQQIMPVSSELWSACCKNYYNEGNRAGKRRRYVFR